VHLSARDAQGTSGFVAWLRDTAADWTPIDWGGDVDGVDTSLLWHLPPPSQGAGAAAARWREVFLPALCYYRNGPGFIQVKDIRDPKRAARVTLEHPAHLEAFRTCLTPARISNLAPAVRIGVDQLAAERLMLVLGGYATTLPVRLRRWPVPAHFVLPDIAARFVRQCRAKTCSKLVAC